MTSTREINTPADYCLQQRGINQQYSHASYKYGWIPERSAFPCLGINMPMMTNGYNNGVLSGNPCAIESALFGIGSNNLANPKGCCDTTAPPNATSKILQHSQGLLA